MAHVLAVDDDLEALDGYATLLRLDGHTVVTAGGGRAAIDLLRRQRFDAVITDLNMPDVDGEAVTRSARSLPSPPCVIVVCARERTRQLLAAGACVVLLKPVDYDELASAVASCPTCGTSRRSGRPASRSVWPCA